METHTEDAQKAVESAASGVPSEVDRILEDARRQLEEAWEEKRRRLQDEADLWRTYAEAQRQMAESLAQAELLTFFLCHAGVFASNLAVYVIKDAALTAWKTRGEGCFPDVLSPDHNEPDAYFKPIVVREKTVAAVYARQPFRAESLDYLSACLARAIEVFGMKLQTR